MDIYAIVTEKILNLLERGVVPWRRPWTLAGLPRNLVSKKPYRGINHFLLSASKYFSPYWLTMRQANELGGRIRKGEESTLIVYWKVSDVKQSTENIDGEATDAKARRRFLLKYYRVFNLYQCELQQAVLDNLPKIETHEHDSIEATERIISGMPNPPEIQHAGSQGSTARSLIESLCRRASSSRVPRNITRRLCTRPSIVQEVRNALPEKGSAKPLPLVQLSTPRKS
jgi:antirestriction protein ArdC